MWTYKHYVLFPFLIFASIEYSFALSCKDENNNDIDWYVNYKLPKINGNTNSKMLSNGSAYAYIISTAPGPWKLSSQTVLSRSSMMANTLKDFYDNKEDFTYIFYNDDSPEQFSGTANGHCKGVVAFDENSGFWLIHSIPKFADPDKYEYPSNALDNGQSILCVTFKTEALNEICNQLLYSNPNMYAKSLTDDVKKYLDENAQSIFSKKPNFIRKPPLTRNATLFSLANKEFVSFAKDNQFQHDLYDSVIAPGLKNPLYVETWRRGAGTVLPPTCETKYDVLDVKSINMTFPTTSKTISAAFKYTEDHSKWAITAKYWVCVADLNRMQSQEKRGGGALCFASKPVWRAYHSIIDETDSCDA